MKTFLLVKLSLLPAIAFWALAGMGHLGWAFTAGAALGALGVAWNWHGGRSRPMETALAVYFVAGGAALLAGWRLDGHLAVGVSFLILGLAGFATCALKRPWTSDYSASEHADVKETQGFKAINMALSLLWSGIFLATFALGAFGLERLAQLLTMAGVGLTIFGPKLAIRFYLKRMLAQRETHKWTAPAFKAQARADEPDVYDVAIIGAGLGGLTAAALLADAGYKVFVAEQHVEPGGFCHSWVRKAKVDGRAMIFRFDSGVHDVSGVRPGGPVTSILARLGVEIDWRRMRHASGQANAPLSPIPENWRAYAQMLADRHPDSGHGIRACFEAVAIIFDSMFAVGAEAGGVPLGPQSPESAMEFAKSHPLAMRWMSRPFDEFLAHYVPEQAARDEFRALAGYISDKAEELTVADMVPILGYYIHGGYYPAGGSGVLGEKLKHAIERRGGIVALKTPVARILIENGRACGLELAEGRKIRAQAVVSNADLKRTICDLLPDEAVPADLRARMAAAEPATSAFMTHLAVKGALAMPEIAHAHLGDLRVGLVCPSNADPSAAPEGYATLELITLLPNAQAKDWFRDHSCKDDKEWRFSPAYEARKQALGDRMIAAAQTLIPDLQERIVFRADASPVTFARYDWSSAGAIYGLAQKDRLKGTKGPVPGLWLAGAGNFGPGVEAVMIAGAAAAESIAPGLLGKKA